MAPGRVSPKWTHYDIDDDAVTPWPKREKWTQFSVFIIIFDFNGLFNGLFNGT